MKRAHLLVSDKVVLTGTASPGTIGVTPPLRRGQVYCVRETVPTTNNGQAVRLVGVQGPVTSDGYEVAIAWNQFRRISHRQQKEGA